MASMALVKRPDQYVARLVEGSDMAGGDCQGVGPSGAGNDYAADGAFANVLSSVRLEDFTPGLRRSGE